MTESTNCRFCEIIRHDRPAEIIYEDDHFVAFLDNAPLTPGHTLVVTREHYDNLLLVPPARSAALFTRVQDISSKLRNVLKAEGVLIASNIVVQQTVQHVHVHIVPRWHDDGLEGFSNAQAPKQSLDDVANQIRWALQHS